MRATVRRGGRDVLSDVSLDVPQGARLAVVGRSGSGKTTLMRLFVGLARPDQGEVLVAGTAPEPARARVGYVVQEGGLFPHLTARENATLAPRLRGVEHDVEKTAELVRLPRELLDRYPAQLSGGQRQRVALLRALAHDPPVLLLDEPFGALDPVVRAELHANLLEVTKDKTLCIVTHDMVEAERLCDQVLVLEEGRAVEAGELREVRARPRHEATRALFAASRP